MNQEAIELLKPVGREWPKKGLGARVILDEKRYLEAIEILKQQPAKGEFTEKLRRFVKLYENEVPRRAEITFLEEACDRLDRAASTKEDLLEACEIGLEKALGISNVAIELGLEITPQHKKNIKTIEAAIAKARQQAK